MNRLRILGAIAAIAVAAGLAACGGGGGGGVSTGGGSGAGDSGGVQLPVRVESPFASANMLVPTGAASKSFAVSGCTRAALPGPSVAIPITSATVVLTANGDMIFSGALGTALVAELGRINFSDANYRDVYGAAGSPTYLGVDYEAADRRGMYLWNDSGFENNPSSGSFRDKCSVGPTTETMTLQQPLSQARVVSSIVTGSTGTVQLSSSISGAYTQTGSIVSWDSGVTGGAYARFISFNLATAQFGQGTLIDSSTHTPVAFSLPAPGSTVSGYYEEYLSSSGDKTIYFRHGNIDVRYRRYADPDSNGGNGRQFQFRTGR